MAIPTTNIHLKYDVQLEENPELHSPRAAAHDSPEDSLVSVLMCKCTPALVHF